MQYTKDRQGRITKTTYLALASGETLTKASVFVTSPTGADVSADVVANVTFDANARSVTYDLVQTLDNTKQTPGQYVILVQGTGSTGEIYTERIGLTITGDPVLHSAVASITITPAGPYSVQAGAALQLTATPKDANGNALTGTPVWSSSDRALATVDTGGKVAGLAAGGPTISVTIGGVTATVAVTVTAIPIFTTGDGSVGDVLTNVAGLVAFFDLATNVTLNGSTVSSVGDVRGSNYLALTGYGAPLPSYNSTAKTARTDGGQNYFKTATDARFALSGASCLVYIGTVEGNYPAIVSTDTVSDFMGITRGGGGSPFYFTGYGSTVAGGQSDLALDSNIHLHRVCQRPLPAPYHGDGGTLNEPFGYYSVGHDVRKWQESTNAGAAYGTAPCSLAVGHIPGNATYTPATVAALLYLDHEPTANEMMAIRRFAAARGATSIGTRKLLACVGDSITYGQGCTTPATDAWPNQIAAQLPTTYAVDKRGRSGRWMSEIRTQMQDLVLNDADGGVAGQWVIVWAGTNDLAGGKTAAQVFPDLKAVCVAALALGILVFVPTVLKRTALTGASETERQNLNALILAMPANGQATAAYDVNLVCDPTQVPAQSPDGTHPNSAKNVDIANAFVSQLQATGKF